MPMTNRADPSNVELAGAALAEVAAQYRPTSVVSWSATLDVLLAHVVARELGIPAWRRTSTWAGCCWTATTRPTG
ncbi:hypothetical protein [Dactylosporangium cerinum]